jgi:hypothetical protein
MLPWVAPDESAAERNSAVMKAEVISSLSDGEIIVGNQLN